MASSLTTHHQHHLFLPSNSSKTKHFPSSFLATPFSNLSSKSNFSFHFLNNSQSSSLRSLTPRRLNVTSMAPPKAKPGGKAKKVIGIIKLALEAGKATPAPPVGPALGSKGVNIMAFCKDYNAKTADKAGYIIPVEITVYDDKSFTFVLKTPPASVLLLKAAGVEKGSKDPQAEKVGKITIEQLRTIAAEKLPDLNCTTIESAMRIIAGTAANMGIEVDPPILEPKNKSEGSYVYDINGKKYLDALAGLWCTALGGNEPRLIAAATAQLNTLPFYHSFWNRTTKPSLDLAKELLETFTARKMGKVFFANSGSEANDSQVKLVWYYNNALGRPNKKKFIARSKSYHGSTIISASLSGLPALHQKFDLPAPFVLHTDCPHYWRYHLPGETEEEFSTRLANNLENLILKEGPETIAAFIAEPVIGAGGVILPPATYFEKIQAVVKKYDILFIADEVICGFGRLGTMFGCDKYNIKPDLVTVAKALSSAYMPIGAVIVSPEVSDVIHSQSNKLGNFSHGFTYSGHPVACAVAIEALKIYKERNIVEQVNSISPRFQDGVKGFSNSPIIGEIRGTGLILGTEFTDNKSPDSPFPSEWGIGAYFGAMCEKHGMLIRVAGDNTMMSPPFIMSPEEVDELISIYGKALKDTEEKVKELKTQQ